MKLRLALILLLTVPCFAQNMTCPLTNGIYQCPSNVAFAGTNPGIGFSYTSTTPPTGPVPAPNYYWLGLSTNCPAGIVLCFNETDNGSPMRSLTGQNGTNGANGTNGTNGVTPTITVGTTTTLPAGQQATVTNTGTAPNVVLNIAIPQGATGPAWNPVNTTLTGTLTCNPAKGSIPAGFTTTCTFKVTAVH